MECSSSNHTTNIIEMPLFDIAKEIAEKLINPFLSVRLKRKGNTVFFYFRDSESKLLIIQYKVERSMIPHIEAEKTELINNKYHIH